MLPFLWRTPTAAVNTTCSLQAARVMMAIGMWSLDSKGLPARASRRPAGSPPPRAGWPPGNRPESDSPGAEPFDSASISLGYDVSCALHHLLLASWWLRSLPNQPRNTSVSALFTQRMRTVVQHEGS